MNVVLYCRAISPGRCDRKRWSIVSVCVFFRFCFKKACLWNFAQTFPGPERWCASGRFVPCPSNYSAGTHIKRTQAHRWGGKVEEGAKKISKQFWCINFSSHISKNLHITFHQSGGPECLPERYVCYPEQEICMIRFFFRLPRSANLMTLAVGVEGGN